MKVPYCFKLRLHNVKQYLYPIELWGYLHKAEVTFFAPDDHIWFQELEQALAD